MADAWSLLGACCIYVLAHFAVYLVVLRHISAFRTERIIFSYHFASFGILLIGVGIACIVQPSADVIRASIGALSVHAVYSMSFLEAWSLAQISYSIAILDAIDARPGVTLEAATRAFADTGSAKKGSRLSALQRLRLITVVADRASLARRGRLVARVLTTLRWVANLRDTG
jgi:hypothetical protein